MKSQKTTTQRNKKRIKPTRPWSSMNAKILSNATGVPTGMVINKSNKKAKV